MTEVGASCAPGFFGDQAACKLYERFVLEYCRREHPELSADAPAVSGMLMYARTDEAILPDGDYLMSGNPISIRSLDLSREFEDVRQQLGAVAEEWF